MVCKTCGKNLANGSVMCSNCGTTMQTFTFQNNKLGENGKRGEYITEKYTMKQGLYEGKAKEYNKSYIGIIFVFVIILIIVLVAIASYLV